MEEKIYKKCLNCGEEFSLDFFDLREKEWCSDCERRKLTYERDLKVRNDHLAFLKRKLNGPRHNEAQRIIDDLNSKPISNFEQRWN